MIYDTVEEIQEACAFWQRTLGLSDWKVVVKLERLYDFPTNVQGQCTWNLERKEAVIQILNHQDWDPACDFEQDHVHTLIHELIHLHFAPFFCEAKPDKETEKEQANHAISRAILRIFNLHKT